MNTHSSRELALSRGVVTLNGDASFVTDRYRLLFAKVDLICRKESKKVLAITSAVKGEGKTTTTSNLSVICAQDFTKRTLVIDGDYKNPSVERRFGLSGCPGLLNVIAKECDLSSALVQGPVDNLTLLTMGQEPKKDESSDGPRENAHIWAANGILSILEEARTWFDYVFIDAPPILPLFDMSVISESVDGIILVVKSGETPQSVLAQAMKSLASDKVIGSVMNRANTSWKSGYDHYNYQYERDQH